MLAVGNWWEMSKKLGLQRYGYVFRKRIPGGANDQVSYRAEDQLVRTLAPDMPPMSTEAELSPIDSHPTHFCCASATISWTSR